jgi:hypothetical protein
MRLDWRDRKQKMSTNHQIYIEIIKNHRLVTKQVEYHRKQTENPQPDMRHCIIYQTLH